MTGRPSFSAPWEESGQRVRCPSVCSRRSRLQPWTRSPEPTPPRNGGPGLGPPSHRGPRSAALPGWKGMKDLWTAGAQLATTPRGPEASLLLHFEELEARQSSSESGCFKDLHGINLPHWPLGKDVANRTWTSCKKIRGIRESLCWSISTPLSHPEWPPPLNPSLWMAI